MSNGPSGPAEPAPLPPQRPIGQAAHAPIGPKSPSATDKMLDTVVIVVAPLVVPAAVFAVVRTGGDRSFFSSFTMADVAFGVVAVVFAALTRALTSKGEGWRVVTVVGLIIIVLQTAIAVSRDAFLESDNLVEHAKACSLKCDLAVLHDLALSVLERDPSTFQWFVTLSAGFLLCSMTLYLIWSEN